MTKGRSSSSSTVASDSTGSAPNATLPVTTLNNVRVYNISGNAHRSLPDWLVRKSAKSLKKDAEWTRRVELIQDLEFPEASLQSRFTPDGKYVIATGTYKPQFRVYELAEMSMKFDRHTDAETVAFEILSDENFLLTNALLLPTFYFNNERLIKRMAIVLNNNKIQKVFYKFFIAG